MKLRMVSLASVLMLIGSFAFADDELAYDDGIPVYGYFKRSGGYFPDHFGVRFTPEGKVRITEAKVFTLYDYGSGATADLYIFDDREGKPGFVKFHTTYEATGGQWDTIPVTSEITFDTDFWIAIKIPESNMFVELWAVSDSGIDHENRNAEGVPSAMTPTGYSWVLCPEAQMKGDLCIRAIVDSSGVEHELRPGEATALDQNSPNPVFNKTSIRYTLPRRTKTELKIYDVAGKVVRTLVNSVQEPGTQEVTWDRRNEQDQKVHSGVYFYRLSTGCGVPLTRPMTVL